MLSFIMVNTFIILPSVSKKKSSLFYPFIQTWIKPKQTEKLTMSIKYKNMDNMNIIKLQYY